MGYYFFLNCIHIVHNFGTPNYPVKRAQAVNKASIKFVVVLYAYHLLYLLSFVSVVLHLKRLCIKNSCEPFRYTALL